MTCYQFYDSRVLFIIRTTETNNSKKNDDNMVGSDEDDNDGDDGDGGGIDRDTLLQTLLTEIPEDDRGVFLTFCLRQQPVHNGTTYVRSHPQTIKFIDFVICAATLRAELDIRDEYYQHERRNLFTHIFNGIDKDGFITVHNGGRSSSSNIGNNNNRIVDDGGSDRDKMIQEVIAEIDEDDRGKFINYCLCYHPVHVKFIDFVIYVATLYHAEILNINNGHYSRESPYDILIRQVDEHGYITSLVIIVDDYFDNDFAEGRDEWDDDYIGYTLPEGIGRLTKLRRLVLWGVGRLPNSLSSLEYMQQLEIINCNDLSNLVPQQSSVLLRHVECLTVNSCNFQSDSPSKFFEWIGNDLPNLVNLTFDCMSRGLTESDDLEQTIDVLCNLEMYGNAAKLYTKLETIGFTECFGYDPPKTDDTLLVQKFLTSAVPKFSSNLNTIDLHSNSIDSRSLSSITLPPSIHYINLKYTFDLYPKSTKWEKILIAETDAIVKFLETNSNVISLSQTKRYTPRIKYGLLQNQAGRNIIQRSRRGMHEDQHDNATTDSRELFPPSILPFYLERAYTKSDRIYTCGGRRRASSSEREKDSSGIYYLLQEMGPVVFGFASGDIRRPRRRRSGSANTTRCRRLRRRLVDGSKTTK